MFHRNVSIHLQNYTVLNPERHSLNNLCVKIGELIHKYYNMSISELLHLEYSFVIVLKFGNSEIQRIIYDIYYQVQEIIIGVMQIESKH